MSLALSSNLEMADNLIDQVVTIATNAKAVRSPHAIAFPTSFDADVTFVAPNQKPSTYPIEELEWVATTTFNRAIDFYCTSQDDLCRRWAEKAISLADLSDDDGRLHQLLEERYLGLTWDR